MAHSLVFTIFLIFAGAAVLATVALYARQALIVAYIVLGILFGPSVLGWVADATLIQGWRTSASCFCCSCSA